MAQEYSRLAPEASADIRALKAEFQRLGFYDKPTQHILLQLLAHVLIALGGIALVLSDGLWSAGAGIVVFSIGATGVATNTHTSAHFATSNRRWLNQALTYFGYPFFLGLGATYWWKKHNVHHHGGPNVIGVDEDIVLTPWFAFSQEDIPEHGVLRRLYYRLQWLGMPIAALSMAIQLQYCSFQHLWRVYRQQGRLNGAHQLDLALLGVHWLLWVVLPLTIWPATSVLAFTVLRLCLQSCILFALFVPAHFPEEAVVLHAEQRGTDNFLLQTATTVNFSTGPFGRWISSGLEYQVVHHLFPGISHLHYRKIDPLLAQFCERNGYPYRTFGWGVALWKTLLNFVRPKPVSSTLERTA